MKTNRKQNLSVITKLENAIAIAVMRGDREAEAKFTKALEHILNQTGMRHFI